jgi:hypothetical protein
MTKVISLKKHLHRRVRNEREFKERFRPQRELVAKDYSGKIPWTAFFRHFEVVREYN